MEPSFNTSFIPKKSLQAEVGGGRDYVKRRGTYGPGFFLTALLFACALLASLGLFFYTSSIESSIEQKIQKLTDARDALRPDLVAGLELFDTRLREATRVVANHRATSAFLEHLEDITLRDVQYQRMTYTLPERQSASAATGKKETSVPMIPRVELEGKGVNMETVALQVEQFRSSEHIQSVVLEEVDRDIEESEETGFRMSLQIDPRLVDFGRLVESGAVPEVVPAPAPVAPEAESEEPAPAEGVEEVGEPEADAAEVPTEE